MFETVGNIAIAVIAFYLVVFCNFTAETLGCNLQYILRTNMYAKHILSLILMLLLVILVNPKEADKNFGYKVLLAVGVYFWFLVTTRCPFFIMVIVLLLLISVYVMNATKSRYEGIDDFESKQKAKQIKNTQNYVAIGAFVLSLMGFIIYLIEKQREYGDDFSLIKFFSGDVVCKNYTPSYLQIIK